MRRWPTGGWLCLRAAAFEPRIQRVIASAIAYDYMRFPNLVAQQLGMLFFNHFRDFSDRVTLSKMKKDPMHAWSIGQMLYITNTTLPMQGLDTIKQLSAANLCSDRVTQDVLILTGRNDHFIPFKMHRQQVRALCNARSLTAEVFTRETQAHNHCQVGNIGLALKTMADWIDRLTDSSGADGK
ncbi:MAG: hypothetical protein P9M14_10200 [Candidatus Alcyoniella australis]|nr:hypothetical protein [Candidatus Alcyoniella australis]